MTTELMEYLPTQPPGGSRKYTGDVAQGYDAKRESSDKWKTEQDIIEDMLSDLAEGSWILDAPCGTGRFFDFYQKKNFIVRGIDISADMLAIAAQKVRDVMKFRFAQTSVQNTGLEDKSVDASLMIRLTRWLCPEECQEALKELQRVTRQKIIFTARVRNHPQARPLALFEEALDGWKISKDVAGYHEDYRIVMLEPIDYPRSIHEDVLPV